MITIQCRIQVILANAMKIKRNGISCDVFDIFLGNLRQPMGKHSNVQYTHSFEQFKYILQSYLLLKVLEFHWQEVYRRWAMLNQTNDILFLSLDCWNPFLQSSKSNSELVEASSENSRSGLN